MTDDDRTFECELCAAFRSRRRIRYNIVVDGNSPHDKGKKKFCRPAANHGCPPFSGFAEIRPAALSEEENDGPR